MKKTNKAAAANVEQSTAQPEAPQTPKATGPVLTPELVAQLRNAGSLDAGLKLLQPEAKSKAKHDAVYELNTDCKEPLPAVRGACLKVAYAVAQFDKPFTVADVVKALPDLKSAPYWTRKLATSGHLREVEAKS